MQRLLYHTPDNPNQESPFDRAIVQVVHGHEVSIVSPYIGMKYLRRIIGLSTSWRLISDILEWLSATPVQQRAAIYNFLKEHDGLVHHYPSIHAKTVVSSVGAYTGSANLTDTGVLRRTEFGILITNPSEVQEIQQWFDAIWTQTSPPSLQSVLKLIEELNKIPKAATQLADLRAAQLESGARRVRAKLVKILGHKPVSVNARLQPNPEAPSRTVAPAQPAYLALEEPATTASRQPSALPFDLDTEIDSYVSRYAAGTFTFAELHSAMRRLSPSLTIRDTYLGILEFCASHPRVLFSEEAMNRLVYRDGRFFQSSKEQLIESLRPMDKLVSWIIDSLSFAVPVPKLTRPTQLTFSTNTFRRVLDGMVKAGFIRQHDGLSLIPTAAWSQRLKLLERSHLTWNARLTKYQFDLTREQNVMDQPAVEGPTKKVPPKVQAARESTVVENEEIETAEESASRRLEKFDQIFSHLAWLYGFKGEVINSSIEELTFTLMDLSKLSLEEIKRLISGTYSLFRSPFIVLQTESKRRYNIVADILENKHLKNLPKTSEIIKKSQSLKDLTQPAQALSLEKINKRFAASSAQLQFNIAQADQAYQSICKRIFEDIASPMPSMRKASLLPSLCRSGANQYLVNQLIFASQDTQFNLFKVERYANDTFTLKLAHKNLEKFPNTHNYLKEVVWASGKQHYSLFNLEKAKEDASINIYDSILRDITHKTAHRDRAYVTLLDFIVRSIPQNMRYKKPDALIYALNGAKLNIIELRFLLGIQQKTPKQLLKIKSDKKGFFLELDHKTLSTYVRCQKYFKSLMESKRTHSWLSNSLKEITIPEVLSATEKSQENSATKSSSQFKNTSANSEKIDAFTPLIWSDPKHLELDNFYCDLAKIYINHGDSVMLSSKTDQQLQDMALAKYLQIAEFRKAYAHKHSPILSLHIFEEPKRLELVTYHSSFDDEIRSFPKLQRILSKSNLRLREV